MLNNSSLGRQNLTYENSKQKYNLDVFIEKYCNSQFPIWSSPNLSEKDKKYVLTYPSQLLFIKY